MFLCHEHHVHIHKPAEARAIILADGEEISSSWKEMAVVLDAGCCGLWNHKQYYGCGCGSILSTRVANCVGKLLLVLDATNYDVCGLGECAALGELAGKADGRSESFQFTAG